MCSVQMVLPMYIPFTATCHCRGRDGTVLRVWYIFYMVYCYTHDFTAKVCVCVCVREYTICF